MIREVSRIRKRNNEGKVIFFHMQQGIVQNNSWYQMKIQPFFLQIYHKARQASIERRMLIVVVFVAAVSSAVVFVVSFSEFQSISHHNRKDAVGRDCSMSYPQTGNRQQCMLYSAYFSLLNSSKFQLRQQWCPHS